MSLTTNVVATRDLDQSFRLELDAEDHSAFVRWAYGLFGYVPSADDCKRTVFATPYPGCYGHAGYVLTIEGSPPRGTILLDSSSGQMLAMRQHRVVRGSRYLGASRAAEKRYNEAVQWVERFGLPVPPRGY